ncbi:hypothetical protein L7F22_046779 [Adiantum nelumboides]|nr:hypothetical protein [Adiantum nelumboides]
MDGNKEEGSSSEDRQPIPTAHEIGESSSQAEKALQVVTAVTMFKQLMENPRFMEFIQSSSIAHQVQGSFGMPGTVFRGMQGMVPNPMYANIGLHPGFQGTQGQFGVSQGNERLARLEAALKATAGKGQVDQNGELFSSLLELRERLEKVREEHAAEREKWQKDQERLSNENTKLQYRVTHLIRSVREADKKLEEATKS